MNVFISVWSSSLVLHTRQLKEDNGKLKQNAERYGVREDSTVEVHRQSGG